MSNYKVRLIPISSMLYGDTTQITANQVVFEVTPSFTESKTVEYAAVTPVHMPGSVQMYRNTSARTFDIGAHLISRNGSDAAVNRRYLQRLRGWTMPYFGNTTTLSGTQSIIRRQNEGFSNEELGITAIDRARTDGVQLRGAPPDVLYLYAYSTASSAHTGNRSGASSNINRVPVVVTSLSIVYPEDVDYIPVDSFGGAQEPFPVKMDVSITLVETHSPREFETFDLAAYKSGVLSNF